MGACKWRLQSRLVDYISIPGLLKASFILDRASFLTQFPPQKGGNLSEEM